MWTGQALVAPRTELTRLGEREEVRSTGIYVLVGPVEDQTAVYVGEGDDVWDRLKSHDSNKDFWTWVVVFVSKDDNLTKAHVRWLEARLIQEIRAAKLVQVVNGNGPGGGRLPEVDEADMETFLENVRLLLPVLGLNVFTSVTGNPKSLLRLRLTWDTATADCIVKEGAFVVQLLGASSFNHWRWGYTLSKTPPRLSLLVLMMPTSTESSAMLKTPPPLSPS